MKSNVPLLGLHAGFLLPHPPILVPAVGQNREAEASVTVDAYRKIAHMIAEIQPDTLVILSPHAPLYRDYVYVYNGKKLSGSFSQFGASEPVMDFTQDSELRSLIISQLDDAGIPAGSLEKAHAKTPETGKDLDHGVLVPLHFIQEAYSTFSIVVLASGAFNTENQYVMGTCLRKAIELSGRSVCVIASGDLSHKVNVKSPYGAVKEGSIFDGAITEALRTSDIPALMSADPDFREKAAECGYGSIVILCGAFDGIKVTTSMISYEAPFGIGYCVASFMGEKVII